MLMFVYNSCDNAPLKPLSYQSPRTENPGNTEAAAVNAEQANTLAAG
jgi:hypothetical protein